MDTKDIKYTVEHLKNYQDWRRGNIEQIPKPKDVGKTIDKAILILEQSTQMRDRIEELEGVISDAIGYGNTGEDARDMKELLKTALNNKHK